GTCLLNTCNRANLIQAALTVGGNTQCKGEGEYEEESSHGSTVEFFLELFFVGHLPCAVMNAQDVDGAVPFVVSAVRQKQVILCDQAVHRAIKANPCYALKHI